MNKSCRNIYKTARESAGLTQEQASEKLNVGVRTLSQWENSKTPPEDIVDKMIEVYGEPRLAYLHIKQTLLGKYFPEMNSDDLSVNVLRFQKEYRDIETIEKTMIEIACDGQIDETEESVWTTVTKEIEELISVSLALKFMKSKKPSKVGLEGL